MCLGAPVRNFPELGLLDQRVHAFLIWKDIDKLHAIGVVLIYFLTDNLWKFFLQYTVVSKLLDLGPLVGEKVWL